MDRAAPEDDNGVRPMDAATPGGDVAAGAACVAAAVLGHLALVPFGVYVPDSVAGTLDSPAVMPLIMLTALGLLGAALLGSGLRARASSVPTAHGRPAADWRKAGGMLAICAGYMALMVVIGLPIASAIALVATLRYFGGRRWAVMVSLGIVVPAVLWFFFVHVVHVPMPPALLEIGQLHDAGLAGGAPA
jgi:hypothetical protein